MRALLKDRKKGQIPRERKEKLLQIIKDYFKVEDLSEEHFEEAANKELLYVEICTILLFQLSSDNLLGRRLRAKT